MAIINLFQIIFPFSTKPPRFPANFLYFKWFLYTVFSSQSILDTLRVANPLKLWNSGWTGRYFSE